MAESQEIDALYRRYRAPLRRAVLRQINDPSCADEIVQETFLRALSAERESGLHLRDPFPWLVTIARNLCIDELRHRAVSPINGTVDMIELVDRSDATAASQASDQTFESVAARDTSKGLRTHLRAALASLQPRERRVMWLREELDLSYEEIAAVERTSVGAVRTMAWRVREHLRTQLPRGPFSLVPVWVVIRLRRVRDRAVGLLSPVDAEAGELIARLGALSLAAVAVFSLAARTGVSEAGPPRGFDSGIASPSSSAQIYESSERAGFSVRRGPASLRQAPYRVEMSPARHGALAPQEGEMSVVIYGPDNKRLVGTSTGFKCYGASIVTPPASPVRVVC